MPTLKDFIRTTKRNIKIKNEKLITDEIIYKYKQLLPFFKMHYTEAWGKVQNEEYISSKYSFGKGILDFNRKWIPTICYLYNKDHPDHPKLCSSFCMRNGKYVNTWIFNWD